MNGDKLIPHDPVNLPGSLGDYQASPNNHRYFCKVSSHSMASVLNQLDRERRLVEDEDVGVTGFFTCLW